MSEQKEVVRVVERGTILIARVPGTPTIRFEELLINAHGVVRFAYTDLTTHKKKRATHRGSALFLAPRDA